MTRTATAAAALALSLSLAPAGPASASAEQPEPPEVPGLVVHTSEYDVDETAQRVQDALVEAGMVTATVDHQDNAASVGEQLRPTTLVIGGAPRAGTPVLVEAQEAGIDLPQKFLAWEDADGQVWLGYNSAEYVAARAGIDPGSEALSALREASAALVAGASGDVTPVSDGGAPPSDAGYLVEQRSDASVAESVDRYHAAFADAGLIPLATVDHAAGAASIGTELRPTQVTFVGNPEVGTPLLAAQQTIGIDLPTRYLAWEDTDGAVHVAHVDIDTVAERHGVTGVDDALAMVEQGTARFTAAAAGGGDQVGDVPDGGVDTGDGGTGGPEARSWLALGALSLLAAGALARYGRPRRGRPGAPVG